jgi:hypothetical protein
MKIHRNFLLLPAALVFLFVSSFAAANDESGQYMCLIHGAHKTPCDVWRSGNEVAISGFQSAPVFRISGNNNAIDQRGEKYKLLINNGNTIFLPSPGNPFSAITIYGVVIQ